MNIGGYTATGPRDANEDNLYYLDFSDVDSFVNGVCAFAMVSDGMGGYQGGDVASGLAVACAKSYLSQLIEMAAGNRIDLDAPAALAEIVRNAHESILAESSLRGNLSMGATFVGAFVSRTHAWIGHVGDSRAYLVREGICRQLTEDHSRVGRMLSRGVITEEEAQNHPERNRIERALGFSDARADVTEVDLAPGDALLLCSDGVYTVLDVDTLGDCVTSSRDAGAAAQRAVKLALRYHTDDNSTAVIVINDTGGSDRTQKTKPQTVVAASGQDTQVGGVLPTMNRGHRSQVYGRYAQSDGPAWKRVLPFVLAILLIGGAVVMVLHGRGQKEQPVQASVQDAPAPEAAVPEATVPEGQVAEPIPGERAPESTTPTAPLADAAPEEGYDSFVIPQDSTTVLKYIDKNGLAQLFTYDQLGLAEDPVLLPGATVVAQTTADSYGRIEKTYQALSDRYLDDLKHDISRYAEGATTFDSALSQIMGPASYLAFVQALFQDGMQTFDETVAHLAIESLVVTGQ